MVRLAATETPGSHHLSLWACSRIRVAEHFRQSVDVVPVVGNEMRSVSNKVKRPGIGKRAVLTLIFVTFVAVFLLVILANRTFPTDGYLPVWSPDGKTIFFLNQSQIYAINPDGSGLRRLTFDSKAYSAVFPAPDGKKLLVARRFHLRQSENDPSDPDSDVFPYTQHLDLMDLDGSNSKPLFGVANPWHFESVSPTWSPDSKQVAFIYKYPDALGVTLVIVNIDTLAYSAPIGDIYQGMGEPEISSPDWSPGGNELLFLRADAQGNADSELVILEIHNLTTHAIAHRDNTLSAPTWSPDGKRIAGLSRVIYTMNADGTNLHSLGDDGDYLRWSPDSKQIAFIKYRTINQPTMELHIINADGSNNRTLFSSAQGN